MRHPTIRRLTAALFATAALVLANAVPAAAASSGCG